MMRVVGLVMLLVASCGFDTNGLEGQEGAAEPAATAEPAAVPAVMRAEKVEVNRLIVGVLFAHAVQAKNGQVDAAGPPLAPADLDAQLSAGTVEAPELAVDVLYAREVKAKNITVRELHAVEVDIEHEGAEGDGSQH